MSSRYAALPDKQIARHQQIGEQTGLRLGMGSRQLAPLPGDLVTIERQTTEAHIFAKDLTEPPGLIDVALYRRDGFALVEGFVSHDELAMLRDETARVCRGELAVNGAGASDASSSDLSDIEVQRQFLCIHFPHKVSAPMLGLLSHPRAVGNLVEVIGPMSKRCSRCCL